MTEMIITSGDNVKRHEKELAIVPFVYKNSPMGNLGEKPYADQGRRLRWLRRAEGIRTASAFAAKYGWPQSGMSQFETGTREVPSAKVRQLSTQIPGFDPKYLWEGEKRGLSFDLRQRLEAEEAKEMGTQSASMAER